MGGKTNKPSRLGRAEDAPKSSAGRREGGGPVEDYTTEGFCVSRGGHVADEEKAACDNALVRVHGLVYMTDIGDVGPTRGGTVKAVILHLITVIVRVEDRRHEVNGPVEGFVNPHPVGAGGNVCVGDAGSPGPFD